MRERFKRYHRLCILVQEEAVQAETITKFKRLLNVYMDRKGLEGYEPNEGQV